ncbi:guanylate kinase [Mesomycoplasma lagogenitalium]|uniref:Guanylate kinase n=1 Tax=Mesomycoplasma lagogenitalium TaxID=171286 RepID=A0ABY8LTI0_9BACT|nr:guanylate kinase [Mesomycoplasma lagogenitalium]WGI36539.1 guanylate kinase [Mesomycoplasma lagogenitalium]
MNKNKLIILAGPSGVGKGTVENILFADEKLKNILKLSCSATTRKARQNETDGIHYYFISEEDFLKKIENNEFIEWNKHFNNYYGTLYSEIKKINKEGYLPLLEIETVGALNIMKYYNDKNKKNAVISIFLAPPSLDELKTRIKNRGTENQDEIDIRIRKAEEEIAEMDKFIHKIVNDTPEKAAQKIKEIILKEIEEKDE